MSWNAWPLGERDTLFNLYKYDIVLPHTHTLCDTWHLNMNERTLDYIELSPFEQNQLQIGAISHASYGFFNDVEDVPRHMATTTTQYPFNEVFSLQLPLTNPYSYSFL